jgi:hypothetical protein
MMKDAQGMFKRRVVYFTPFGLLLFLRQNPDAWEQAVKWEKRKKIEAMLREDATPSLGSGISP